MNNNHKDIDSIFQTLGKQIPYTLPKGFFEQTEVQLAQQLKLADKSKPLPLSNRLWQVVGISVAAAAVAAVGIFLPQRFTPQSAVSDSEVDQAFNQLSSADQTFLLEVYQEDVFFDDNSPS